MRRLSSGLLLLLGFLIVALLVLWLLLATSWRA
jgi:hypothetical protein